MRGDLTWPRQFYYTELGERIGKDFKINQNIKNIPHEMNKL